MALETYILIAVSAGIMEEKDKEPMPYASVVLANAYGRNTGMGTNISYGSPVLKCKLVDESTGKPNIELGKRLAKAEAYGKPIQFRGIFELVKVKSVEQMTFTIFDAELDVKPVKAAS